MTNQEAFEISTKHVLNLKERCTNSEGCSYRNEKGSSCAIGILIPDEQYEPGLESMSARELDFLPCLQGLEFDMLEELQITHDYKPDHEPNRWPPPVKKFIRIGRMYNLDTSFLTKM